ncbi:MAG TPA: DUF883 C-terminal domain-containing protein [bacterium]|nr:DUF883 C-terminal domain-containing protein [bacterium]
MTNSKDTVFQKHGNEFKSSASAIGHDVQDLGRATKHLAEDAVNLLKNNASEYYQQGVKKAQTMEKTLESRIKDNPMQALLIAAGVGFVIGAFLARR